MDKNSQDWKLKMGLVNSYTLHNGKARKRGEGGNYRVKGDLAEPGRGPELAESGISYFLSLTLKLKIIYI